MVLPKLTTRDVDIYLYIYRYIYILYKDDERQNVFIFIYVYIRKLLSMYICKWYIYIYIFIHHYHGCSVGWFSFRGCHTSPTRRPAVPRYFRCMACQLTLGLFSRVSSSDNTQGQVTVEFCNLFRSDNWAFFAWFERAQRKYVGHL